MNPLQLSLCKLITNRANLLLLLFLLPSFLFSSLQLRNQNEFTSLVTTQIRLINLLPRSAHNNVLDSHRSWIECLKCFHHYQQLQQSNTGYVRKQILHTEKFMHVFRKILPCCVHPLCGVYTTAREDPHHKWLSKTCKQFRLLKDTKSTTEMTVKYYGKRTCKACNKDLCCTMHRQKERNLFEKVE